MNQATHVLKLHRRDNVAVALHDLPAGLELTVDAAAVTVRENVPRGHKLALAAVPADAVVIKYGLPIGRATTAIAPGAWVHGHNLRTALAGLERYTYHPAPAPADAVAPSGAALTFEGFERTDGQVGIRNELWILPTVGCVNETARALAVRAHAEGLDGACDGVFAFTHPYGCSQLGEDHLNTQRILAALARHPNAGGVLVVGLGCENNTLERFRALLGDRDPARVRFMAAQEEADEGETGLRLLRELAAQTAADRRRPLPASALRVGLKCGGSDAFSGITANPVVGAFSDLLIAHGGTTLLTEVPEMFGAESLFLNRCADRGVFEQCVALVNDFKAYYLRHEQAVYENPSPGNRDGGITTLEEKSLGCLQKGGGSPVVDVLPYAGRLRTRGLSFLSGPGNDIVSVTALAAAGVQLVLFTTGRGTPLGGPVPTLKIASTSELAARKPHWIDFDAGRVLAGAGLGLLGRELLDHVLAIAGGRTRTRNEINGFREIAICKGGVTL